MLFWLSRKDHSGLRTILRSLYLGKLPSNVLGLADCGLADVGADPGGSVYFLA